MRDQKTALTQPPDCAASSTEDCLDLIQECFVFLSWAFRDIHPRGLRLYRSQRAAKVQKKTGLVSQGMTEKPGEFSN